MMFCFSNSSEILDLFLETKKDASIMNPRIFYNDSSWIITLKNMLVLAECGVMAMVPSQGIRASIWK